MRQPTVLRYGLGVALLATLGLATTSLAGDPEPQTIQSFRVPQASELAGVSLGEGDYKVSLRGTGEEQEATIWKGKQALVTTSAKLVAVAKPSSKGYVSLASVGDSVRLVEIRAAGAEFAIRFARDAVATGQPDAMPSKTARN